jgi:hypothetical protein
VQEKILASLIATVFVGALAYELLIRKQPRLVRSMKGYVERYRAAFREGYENGAA